MGQWNHEKVAEDDKDRKGEYKEGEMIKDICKRLFSMTMTIIIILTCTPFSGTTAEAATVSGLEVDGLGTNTDSNGTWKGGGNSIEGSVTGTGGCSSAAKTSKLTLTNNKGAEAQLSFDYSMVLNDGSVNINGTNVTEAGSFMDTVVAGGTVTIQITSAKDETTTSVSLTNISLIIDTRVTTTFVPAENGTYSVNSQGVTDSALVNEQNSTVPYHLKATPASGYKLLGWYYVDTNKLISAEAEFDYYTDVDGQSITAIFTESENALFKVGSAPFIYLNEADQYASSSGIHNIILAESGTLNTSGTVSAGNTLLIPFDDANTISIGEPIQTKTSSALSPYKTLTLVSGTEITVYGYLCVNGQEYGGNGGGSTTGGTTGKYGHINLYGGSSINVESGGKLYAYGYISGDGDVTINGGAEVYEFFKFCDYRGGSAISNMVNKGVFPISQYYVQNIESSMTLYPGATETVYTCAVAGGIISGGAASFIGGDGMFQLSNGSLTKTYDGSTDRLIIDVDGSASVNSMTVDVGMTSVNSNNYVLPINSNITLNINYGETTVSQTIALLPGTEASVAGGATLTIAGGKKVYVYDKDEWGNYGGAGTQLKVNDYTVANGTRKIRNTGNLVDAVVDINGEVISNGFIYTTAGGADIISSGGTGKITFANGAGTETATQQVTQSGSNVTYVDIPITSAKLHNGSPYHGTADEYTPTAEAKAGEAFTYVNDKWQSNVKTVKITYDANAGTDPVTGEMPEQVVEENKEIKLTKNTFVRTGYTFEGWSTTKDSTTAQYTDEQDKVKFDKDTVLYAVWKPVLLKVTWVDEDGETVLYEDDQVPYGTAPEYKGEEPTKTGEDGTIYQFAGWDPQIETVTQDTVLKATYTVKTCNVTWKNYDGTVLATESVAAGSKPEYKGDTPVKELDDGKIYEFVGWDPEITDETVVTEDTEFTAVFEEAAEKFTVTWLDDDGITVLEKDENVEANTKPTYDGEIPVKESDAQYNYIFKGWDPEITDETVVTEDVIYTAVYEKETRTYTITWKNYDGEVLDEDQVPYGETPEYTGGTPDKEGDAQFTYTFDSWTPEIEAVTDDAEYTAVFSQKTNTYTVTWLDDDGTELKSREVPYGQIPEYDEDAPSKEADAQYTYTFKGWDKEITAVTEDVTYTAEYDQTINKYTVKWVNYDGEELETDVDVEYGATPSYDGETPERQATEQYSYTFAGWDPSVEDVTGNVTYKAVFGENVRSYIVTWKNEDGTVLLEEDVEYGQTPVYSGNTPVKEGTDEFTYIFAGWDKEVTAVSEDAEYTAVFTEVVNTYTVVWKDYDGTVLETDENVEYGTTPVYDGEKPARDWTEQYEYSFVGWNVQLEPITGDIEYTAVYKETVRKYTITWKNDDGETLKEDEVEYGVVPAYAGEEPSKEADAQYTYTFKGWDSEPAAVIGDAEYYATYDEILRSYTVTWLNANGEIFETEEYNYGETPAYPENDPVLEKDDHYIYTFKGWTPELEMVTGEATYKAEYDKKGEEHIVSFDANGGSGEMPAQTFEYGVDGNLAPNVFTMEDGKFVGWNTEADGGGSVYSDEAAIENLTEDLKLYAQWKKIGWDTDENGRTWYNEDGERVYFDEWATIDGRDYYFKPDGYVATDLYKAEAKDESHEAIFVFDHETGEFLSDQNGLYDLGEDTYWTENGEVVEYMGLVRTVKDDGEVNYYYFGEDNKAVKNVPEGGQDQWIPKEKTNGLLPEWGYYIDEDGVLLHDEDTSKNGILDEDGGKYYYIDGIRVHMGLIKIGDDYYYVKSKGEVITDKTYYCTRMNGLDEEFPEGLYTFDEEGRMIRPDTTKNGIYAEDGSLYYYENGVRTYGGVMLIDGNYYYAATSGEVVHGRKYWITKTNDLIPEKSYLFDDDGKIIFEEEQEKKNGIYEEDGSMYYYVDGKRTYGGLILIDGDYYYAATSGEVVHGRKYWISKTNDLLPEKSYEFADDGKLILPEAVKNGIYEEDGSLYYYENGVRTYGGVMEIDGNYYYAASSGEVVHGRKYWISKTNDLIPERSYTFDDQGRITDAPEKKDDTVSGIVEEDGSLYYYENGLRTYGGVMLIDGNYYYAATSGEVVHGKKYWISKTNGLLKEKSYTFDENGVITDPEVMN